MKFDDLSKYASLVTVVLSIIISMKTCSWDDKLKDIEFQSKTVKVDQDKISFDREFKFKIYDLTIEAIKSRDSIQQEAAYIVVSSMVTDTTFKKGLLQLFIKSKMIYPSIKKSAKKQLKKEFSDAFSDDFN